MTLISSQRYLDNDTTQEKIDTQDFTVSVSPKFTIDGEEYQVILDGHHSFAAAIESGNEPEFIELSVSEHDAIQWLVENKPETFLEVTYIDSPYYDINTGIDVF